jgi:hypothetical protein
MLRRPKHSKNEFVAPKEEEEEEEEELQTQTSFNWFIVFKTGRFHERDYEDEGPVV